MPKKPANRKYSAPEMPKTSDMKFFTKSGNHLIKKRIGMVSYCGISLKGWHYDDTYIVKCGDCMEVVKEEL
jgi:hypothetical protein